MPSVNKPKVQIKGIRDGLLVTLGEGSWPELVEAMLQHIDDQASFFRGAKLTLDVGSQSLKAVDLGGLRDTLSDRGVALWGVLSSSATTEKTAQILGLATRISTPRSERVTRPNDQIAASHLGGDNASLIQKTLRSGTKIQYDGHVIIIGDVNPGAEIVAGGCVVVWGKIRGTVHAGSAGDEKAVVCALDLSPTQLRIAGHQATGFSWGLFRRRGKSQPEVARLMAGKVVAEIWNTKLK
jgi:septum site-determining protein MinC